METLSEVYTLMVWRTSSTNTLEQFFYRDLQRPCNFPHVGE